ncbi:MAG: hypothetical protein ACLU30_14670 [Odoribacter splanchnicus]
MKVGVYILLLFFLFFSCKQVETGHVTVIHLQPNEKSILKVSDYFNRVEAVLLRDTFFFGVEDFIEGADKYIVLASDHPGLMQGKDRYYVFDKEGISGIVSEQWVVVPVNIGKSVTDYKWGKIVC